MCNPFTGSVDVPPRKIKGKRKKKILEIIDADICNVCNSYQVLGYFSRRF